jgi:hypothetical protein
MLSAAKHLGVASLIETLRSAQGDRVTFAPLPLYHAYSEHLKQNRRYGFKLKSMAAVVSE